MVWLDAGDGQLGDMLQRNCSVEANALLAPSIEPATYAPAGADARHHSLMSQLHRVFEEATEQREASQSSATQATPATWTQSTVAVELDIDSAQAAEPNAANNRTMGYALSHCIQMLEQDWIDRCAAAQLDRPGQKDINTLESFRALKHFRDLLEGKASKFDPIKVASAVSESLISTPQSADQGAAGTALVADALEQVQSHAQAPDMSRNVGDVHAVAATKTVLPMKLGEYARYGRQMILPDFGLAGQLCLRRAKVLVVGAGGLGCPAIQYLAAAGAGHISIHDPDVVELSNLVREILHNEHTIGIPKAVSAAQAVQRINPKVAAVALENALTAVNAREVIRGKNVVLDCTDNPLTRYLISDAAVLEGVEVVSGAAQGYDGQLVVLHKRIKAQIAGPEASGGGDTRGPCYRCLFPKAPPPDEVANCEDGGVLGGVTGLVGAMQALEAIKMLVGLGEGTPPMLTLVAPVTGTPFLSVRVRPRRIDTCRACGDPLKVTERMITDLDQEDYASFCGLESVPAQFDNIPRTAVSEMRTGALVVDVRPKVEFDITHLNGSLNMPMQELLRDPQGALVTITNEKDSRRAEEVLVVCRRGNDSQLAVHTLLRLQNQYQAGSDAAAERQPFHHTLGQYTESGAYVGKEREPRTKFKISDLIGGLRAYTAANPEFPVY